MDGIKIGDGPFDLDSVIQVIQRSSSSYSLGQKWQTLAYNLNIDDAKIASLSRKVNTGLLRRVELLGEVMRLWKAEKGNNATLLNLYNVLNETGANDISASLEDAFVSQLGQILEVEVFKDIYRLEQLIMTTPLLDINRNIHHGLLENTSPLPLPLFKAELSIPLTPSYYIERVIIEKTEIDKGIFRADLVTADIFAFLGISRDDLTKFIPDQPIDTSKSQTLSETTRFFIVNTESEFDFSLNKSHRPAHLIEFKDDSFHWIKSSKGLQTIQEFIKDNGILQTEIEITTKMCDIAGCRPVCISDSPGMGKTFLLSRIARNIQKKSQAIPIFIFLEEFVSHMFRTGSVFSALHVLAAYCGYNKISEIILREVLRNDNFQFNLYLDAYDEIAQEKRGIVDDFIRQVKQLNNFRLFVTTRPHFKGHLENLLEIISLEICPFSEQNQVDFLKKFWIHQLNTPDESRLDAFARHILSQLHTNLSKQDSDIAGIPLQCMLIADAYSPEAFRFSNQKSSGLPKIRINSMFGLYKNLVSMRINKRNYGAHNNAKWKARKRNYIQAHVLDSIKLLFPDWTEKLSICFKDCDHISSEEKFSIGIVEKSTNSSIPRFVHRTFAEYLFADFLVRWLNINTDCKQLVFGVILGKKGIKLSPPKPRFRPHGYQMEYDVVAYFIDRKLRELEKSKFIDRVVIPSLSNYPLIIIDTFFGLSASCLLNLEACFDLTSKIFCLQDKNEIDMNPIRDLFFKHLPQMTIQQTNNLALTKRVVELIRKVYKVGLSYHVFSPEEVVLAANFISRQKRSIDSYRYPWIRNSNPLHVAIGCGNYNIVTYLLKEYEDELCSQQYMFHVCLRDSSSETDAVIQDKILIIRLIAETAKKLGKDWIEEEFEESGCTPLLQDNVHFKLIQCMVELGANLNASSKLHGTVLHKAIDQYSLLSLIPFAIENGFAGINNCDGDGMTSVQRAVVKFGALEENVLKSFAEAGADLNSIDNEGLPLLCHAIKLGNPEFVSKLLDFGANLNYISRNGSKNMVHLTLEHAGNWSSQKIISVLNVIITPGFTGLNEADSDGHQPLHTAMALKNLDDDLLDFFKAKKADFNATDRFTRSVLIHAILQGHTSEAIQKMIECGADPYKRASEDQGALHAAAYYGNDSVYRYLSAEQQGKGHHVDSWGNMPAHLLFYTDNSNNEYVLSYILSTKTGYYVENDNGNVPLVEWVRRGITSLFTLVKVMDDLPITSHIASRALVYIIVNEELQKHYLVDSSEDQKLVFVRFVLFLVENKAYSLFPSGRVFQWGELDNTQKTQLNGLKITSSQFIRYIFETVCATVVPEVSEISIGDLVLQVNISLQVLLLVLLTKEHHSLFMSLCKIIAGQESDNCLPRPINNVPNSPDYDLDNILDPAQIKIRHKDLSEVLPWIPDPSLLHLFAKKGFLKDVQMYLETLASYMDETRRLKHVLHACVRNTAKDTESVIAEKIQIIDLLVHTNQDWLEERLDGNPPLLEPDVHIRLRQHLVHVGADINSLSSKGASVLSHTNSGANYMELVQWAINTGFNHINSCSEVGITPLMMAIHLCGNIDDENLSLFQKTNADFNAADSRGVSVLFYAISVKNLEFVQKILDLGADINHTCTARFNAAYYLISYGKDVGSEYVLTSLQLFLLRGFNLLNAPCSIAPSPLYAAVEIKDVDEKLLHFFYENGSDFNVCNENGQPLLFHAIQRNVSVDCINKIIDCGANVNHIRHDNLNAAHSILLFTSQDSMNCEKAITLLQTIVSKGFNCALLNQPESRGFTPLQTALLIPDMKEEILDFFITNRADFNVLNDFQESLLFDAIREKQGSTIISKLIQCGMNQYHLNSLKQNALHIAVMHANSSALEFLVDKFPDINAQDEDGFSPLHYVFLIKKETYRDVLKILLQRQVSFEVENASGLNPLLQWIFACEDSIEIILEFGDTLPISSKIASGALTAIVTAISWLEKIAMDSPQTLAKLLKLLRNKGGKLLNRDEHPFKRNMLTEDNLLELDSIAIPMGPEHQHESCTLKSLVQDNAMRIEDVLELLINSEQIDSLMALCRVLTEKPEEKVHGILFRMVQAFLSRQH